MSSSSTKRSAGGERAYYGTGLPIKFRSVAGLFAEGVVAFINWSLFVEYIAIIWFYPMGFMGFTGMEVFLLAMFTPLLLGIGPISRLVGRFSLYLRFAAQMLALVALYPTDIDPKNVEKHEIIVFENPHVTRTVFVGLAISIDWLCQCRSFINHTASSARRERTSFAYMLGIVFHALIRLPYLSINPFLVWREWVIFGGILVAIAFVILLGEPADEQERRRPILEDAPNAWTTGMSLGGLLFSSQLLISTYGLIPRWVNLGPYPGGIVVLVLMIAGIVIAKKTALVTSRNYFFGALICGAIFGLCSGSVPTTIGLIGLLAGSLVGTYLMSLWFVVVERTSATTKPFRLFLSCMLTYTVLLFWSIYVVSYKFVPWYLGSTLLRERHQTLVLACIFSAGIGAINFQSRPSSPKKEVRGTSTFPSREVFYIIFGLLIGLFLFSVNRNLSHPTHASVAGHHYERITNSTHLENIAPKEIKSMIWTIHFGYDNYGRNSFSNITSAIRDHGVNVIGLLESDLSRVMTANRDLVEWLASELHMHSDFGPAPSENTWGCALLTIFPIISSKHVILPSPEGELACLIDAVINVDDTPVNIIVTHFGNTEDKLDRELQAQGAAQIIKDNDMPTVFLSYITDKMSGPNYKQLRDSGLQDTTNVGRYCEYIFYKDLEKTHFERWPCGEISDTEGQIAHFKPIKAASPAA
eukprot:gene14910-17630_t